MPFVSQKQKRYMFAKLPKIAKRWIAEGKGYVKSRKARGRKRASKA